MTTMISKKHHWVPVGFMKGFSIGFPDVLFQEGRDNSLYWGMKGNCDIRWGKAEKLFFKNHLYSRVGGDGNRDDEIEKILSEHDHYLLETSRYLYKYFFDGSYKKKPYLSEVVKRNIIYFMKVGYKRSYRFLKSLEDEVKKNLPDESDEQRKIMVLHLFCQFGEGQHEGIPSIDDVLAKKGTIIFIIRSNKKRFIMSDSLFFQLEEDGLANENNEFCFPLNEKIFILKTAKISEKQYDVRELYDKDMDTIRFINERIVITADRMIAGSNEALVKSLCSGVSWKTR